MLAAETLLKDILVTTPYDGAVSVRIVYAAYSFARIPAEVQAWNHEILQSGLASIYHPRFPTSVFRGKKFPEFVSEPLRLSFIPRKVGKAVGEEEIY